MMSVTIGPEKLQVTLSARYDLFVILWKNRAETSTTFCGATMLMPLIVSFVAFLTPIGAFKPSEQACQEVEMFVVKKQNN